MDLKIGSQSTKNVANHFPGSVAQQSVGNFTVRNKSNVPASNFKSEIWVSKWVDYSSKYGLGYLLSNGSTGVFFNDATKIILNSKERLNFFIFIFKIKFFFFLNKFFFF